MMKNKQKNFKFFESILTFAIDEYYEANTNSASFPLNEKVFFEQVYVTREKKEEELEYSLRTDRAPLYFIGQPGTGKTTVVRKVLSKLKEDNGLILYFDFKKIPGINNEVNQSFENMSQFITDCIQEKIKLDYPDISTREIIYFLEQKRELAQAPHNPKLTRLLSNLRTVYDFDLNAQKEKTYLEWLEYSLFNSFSTVLQDICWEIFHELKPHNYLSFLINKDNIERNCVLAFDNIDSILDTEIRGTFQKVVRNELNIYRGIANIVCVIREKNIVDYSDFGSQIVNEINLNYEDLIPGEYLETETAAITESPDPERIRQILKITNANQAKDLFAKKIYNKRLNFFKNNIAILDESIEEMEAFYELIHNDDWLASDFFELCNFNRRQMLVDISNFIEYIVFDRRYSLSILTLNKYRLSIILQTFFYSWIKYAKKYYEDEIYNLPKDVDSWKRRKEPVINCNIDHLIFCVIFNLSKQEYRNFSYGKKAQLKEVISVMSEIGYNSDLVLERIHFLHKEKNGIHKGLLEFYNEHDRMTRKTGIQVSLTPRSCNLLSFSSTKFYSVFADLKEEVKRKSANKSIELYENDLEPITTPKLKLYIMFLLDLAQSHIEALYHIKDELQKNNHKNWLEHFKKIFCFYHVKQNYSKIEHPELLFNRLLLSNIKFLKRQSEMESEIQGANIRVKIEMIEQFEKLQIAFDRAVSDIDETPLAELPENGLIKAIDLSIFK